MSCTRLYVKPTATLTSQGRKSILVKNIQSCRSCYPDIFFPKLSFSITTDQLVHSGLIANDNDSLGGRELDNETKTLSVACYVKPH